MSILMRTAAAAALGTIAFLGTAQAETTGRIRTIFDRGVRVGASSSAAMLRPDGSTVPGGLRVGEAVPDRSTIAVGANASVVVAYPGGSATLEAGARETFSFSGRMVTVAQSAGKSVFDEIFDLFRITSTSFNAAGNGTRYAVDVTSSGIVVTCTQGSVNVSRFGSASGGDNIDRGLLAVRRVDRISARGRSSVTYGNGDETQATAERQFELARAKAENGDIDAQVTAGAMYAYGFGVVRDYGAALRYFRASARSGDANAYANLGVMSALGWGTRIDDGRAAQYFAIAAEKGSAVGQNDLGFMYELLAGLGADEDYAKAKHFFELAAAQGLATSQNALGVMYAGGIGTPTNYAMAARYYGMAAAQNSGFGQVALGDLYLAGRGVGQSALSAAGFYRQAADRGNPLGEFRLGGMYERGNGVSRDSGNALRYYDRAARHGLGQAGYAAQQLRKALGLPEGGTP